VKKRLRRIAHWTGDVGWKVHGPGLRFTAKNDGTRLPVGPGQSVHFGQKLGGQRMVKAFVKTFKHDHVSINDRPDKSRP